MISKPHEIITKISTYLSSISVDNGYNTNLGSNVYHGRVFLFEDDVDNMPFIVIRDNDDFVVNQNVNKIKNTLRVNIEGHAKSDIDNPYEVAHKMVADIKKSVFSNDTTFGIFAVNTRYVGREISAINAGQDVISVIVKIEIDYVEFLDDPLK